MCGGPEVQTRSVAAGMRAAAWGMLALCGLHGMLALCGSESHARAVQAGSSGGSHLYDARHAQCIALSRARVSGAEAVCLQCARPAGPPTVQYLQWFRRVLRGEHLTASAATAGDGSRSRTLEDAVLG